MLSNLNGFYADKTIDKQNLTSAYRGKMAEQFVGQELLSSGYRDLFYWKRESRGSSAEIDYLIEKEGRVIPIEVKSGKSGSLKSLHMLLEAFPGIDSAYVFTEDKTGKMDKIRFLPLFRVSTI